jgi:hypothetical protein
MEITLRMQPRYAAVIRALHLFEDEFETLAIGTPRDDERSGQN